MKQNTEALQNPSAWPDGWYVYDNNKVEGPFTASQAFSREAMSADGKQVLVSRKGFTQWYALKDLAEIFKMTENLGRRVDEEKSLAALQNLAKAPVEKKAAEPAPASRRVVRKQVGPVQAAVQAAKSTVVTATAAAEETPAPAAIKMPEYAPPVAKPAPVVKESLKAAPARETASEKKKLLQEYFFVRGRLRLGKIRNPWAAAFFGVPASAGLFWPFWMHAILKEIYLHAANKAKVPVWLVIAGIIPGLHFYAIYRTASLMRAMEMQNRYKSISPALATLFGLFPPFALAYLQDGANRHWMLHARHSGTATKPAA